MGAVPQIAADLPQRPNRQPWAKSCHLPIIGGGGTAKVNSLLGRAAFASRSRTIRLEFHKGEAAMTAQSAGEERRTPSEPADWQEPTKALAGDVTELDWTAEVHMRDGMIVTTDELLAMLDTFLADRQGQWWDGLFSKRDKPIPFFVEKPDENLVQMFHSGALSGELRVIMSPNSR
jgi:hypothetical protein